jgi:hypothetical protein
MQERKNDLTPISLSSWFNRDLEVGSGDSAGRWAVGRTSLGERAGDNPGGCPRPAGAKSARTRSQFKLSFWQKMQSTFYLIVNNQSNNAWVRKINGKSGYDV